MCPFTDVVSIGTQNIYTLYRVLNFSRRKKNSLLFRVFLYGLGRNPYFSRTKCGFLLLQPPSRGCDTLWSNSTETHSHTPMSQTHINVCVNKAVYNHWRTNWKEIPFLSLPILPLCPTRSPTTCKNRCKMFIRHFLPYINDRPNCQMGLHPPTWDTGNFQLKVGF